MIIWEGQMAVRGVQLFMELIADEIVGKCEPDETTERAIADDGTGIESNVTVTNHSALGDLESSYVRVLTPRAQEFRYTSLGNLEKQVFPPYSLFRFLAPIIPSAPKRHLALWVDPKYRKHRKPPPTTPPPDQNPPPVTPVLPVDPHPPIGVTPRAKLL